MKRHAPATARNREPIAAVLEQVLPERGRLLEIASGSGEHAVFFAGRFPEIEIQPSDVDADALASIESWRADAGRANLLPPIRIDVASDWADAIEKPLDAIACINMVHIAPWRCTLGLLAGAARILSPGGLLYLYGPYLRDGVETAPSNLAFDQSLRARDPEWGLRRLEDVVAAAAGFSLERVVEMPANNISALLRRER